MDPSRRIVTVNYFKGDSVTAQYPLGATIKVNIYEDLFNDFKGIGLLTFNFLHQHLHPVPERCILPHISREDNIGDSGETAFRPGPPHRDAGF